MVNFLNAILVENPSTSVGGFSFLVKEELVLGQQEDGYNFNEIKFTMVHRFDFRVLPGKKSNDSVPARAVFNSIEIKTGDTSDVKRNEAKYN